MASLIDPTKPILGQPTTSSVRDNFNLAKNEITLLQNDVGTLQTDVGSLQTDPRFSDDRVASGLRTTTNVVEVDTAVAPIVGHILTATGPASAAWQPAGGGSGFELSPGQAETGVFFLGYWPSNGDTITITDPQLAPAPTTVIYEWDSNNPPVGMPNRVWLFRGGSRVEAEAILRLAFNNQLDARIVYNNVALPLLTAQAVSPTTGAIPVYSASSAGDAAQVARDPSDAFTWSSTTVAGPPNVWMNPTSQGGRLPGNRRLLRYTHILSSAEASGGVYIPLPWTAAGCLCARFGAGAAPVVAYLLGGGTGVVAYGTGALAGSGFYLEVWE